MMVPSSGQRLRRRLRMRFSGPAEKLDLQLAAGRDEAAFLDGGDLCWRGVAFGAPRKVQLAGRADGCRVLALAKGRRFGRQLCGNLVLLIKFSTRPLCAGRNSVQMTGAAILNSRIFAASSETSPATLTWFSRACGVAKQRLMPMAGCRAAHRSWIQQSCIARQTRVSASIHRPRRPIPGTESISMRGQSPRSSRQPSQRRSGSRRVRRSCRRKLCAETEAPLMPFS